MALPFARRAPSSESTNRDRDEECKFSAGRQLQCARDGLEYPWIFVRVRWAGDRNCDEAASEILRIRRLGDARFGRVELHCDDVELRRSACRRWRATRHEHHRPEQRERSARRRSKRRLRPGSLTRRERFRNGKARAVERQRQYREKYRRWGNRDGRPTRECRGQYDDQQSKPKGLCHPRPLSPQRARTRRYGGKPR
jgi:hypothetical protein